MFKYWGVALVVLSITTAEAEFRVCNDTASPVAISLGYQDGDDWVTKGWWRIAPVSCGTVIKDSLKSRYYYLYGESNKEEGNWEGPIFLCVKDLKFNIKGVRDCYVRGYQKAGFQEIDTGNHNSWTVHLKPNSSF